MRREFVDELCEFDEEFKEFWHGYTQAVGFTGHEDTEVSDYLFDSKGEFDDCVTVYPYLRELLQPNELKEMVTDAWGFLQQVRQSPELWEEVSKSLNRAGTDFHFSRNGHGAGFWDGDWEHGTALDNMAEAYRSLEVTGQVKNPRKHRALYLVH